MKLLPEDRCEETPEGQTMGECGTFTYGVQCANCTKRICFEHSLMCKACRDECRHHMFCGNCINSHKHEDVQQFTA
jgi:hypothetical protein